MFCLFISNSSLSIFSLSRVVLASFSALMITPGRFSISSSGMFQPPRTALPIIRRSDRDGWSFSSMFVFLLGNEFIAFPISILPMSQTL
jgi:hypothetical protein